MCHLKSEAVVDKNRYVYAFTIQQRSKLELCHIGHRNRAKDVNLDAPASVGSFLRRAEAEQGRKPYPVAWSIPSCSHSTAFSDAACRRNLWFKMMLDRTGLIPSVPRSTLKWIPFSLCICLPKDGLGASDLSESALAYLPGVSDIPCIHYVHRYSVR